MFKVYQFKDLFTLVYFHLKLFKCVYDKKELRILLKYLVYNL